MRENFSLVQRGFSGKRVKQKSFMTYQGVKDRQAAQKVTLLFVCSSDIFAENLPKLLLLSLIFRQSEQCEVPRYFFYSLA